MLIINLLLPGVGTIIFSFKWLGFEDYAFEAPCSIRCKIASIGIACGIFQLLTTPLVVGWGFAILTGLMAVQQAYWIAAVEEDMAGYYDNYWNDLEEQQLQDTTEAQPTSSKQVTTGDKVKLRKPWRPRKKMDVPPGWVYRLYPGFINSPEHPTQPETVRNQPTSSLKSPTKSKRQQ